MSEAFSQWYETAKLEVHGIHTVSDMQKAYTAGLLRAAKIAESVFCFDEAEEEQIAAAIRKEAGE